jgi:hypothetical protein
MVYVLKLTNDQERDALTGLLDLAVKAGGLKVAETALALLRRIEKAPAPESPAE